jgi:hypothetical protein
LFDMFVNYPSSVDNLLLSRTKVGESWVSLTKPIWFVSKSFVLFILLLVEFEALISHSKAFKFLNTFKTNFLWK